MGVEHYKGYEIRLAEPRHVQGFIELHNGIFGGWGPKAEEQFSWKYIDNPYFEGIPVIVVTHGGLIVGARGYFALNINIGGRLFLGLQSGDLMVHPDHRRKGLFREMNRYGTRVLSGPNTFFFSFPNRGAQKAYRRQKGWVGVRYPLYVYSPVMNGLFDRLYRRVGGRYSVEPIESPIGEMASLGGGDNRGVSILRDEKFYKWRMREPIRDFHYYAVKERGSVRSIFIFSVEGGGICLREIVPDSVSAITIGVLLSRLSDMWGTRVKIKSWCPAGIGAWKFVRSGMIPRYIPFVSSSSHIIVGNVEGKWIINGVDVRRPVNWNVQLIGRDW